MMGLSATAIRNLFMSCLTLGANVSVLTTGCLQVHCLLEHRKADVQMTLHIKNLAIMWVLHMLRSWCFCDHFPPRKSSVIMTSSQAKDQILMWLLYILKSRCFYDHFLPRKSDVSMTTSHAENQVLMWLIYILTSKCFMTSL
jgi:hypothetical protein